MKRIAITALLVVGYGSAGNLHTETVPQTIVRWDMEINMIEAQMAAGYDVSAKIRQMRREMDYAAQSRWVRWH